MEKKNQPVRCVIFDCDGVLVDSEILASQVSLNELKPYGVEMTPHEYARKYAGKKEEDILKLVQEEYQINLPADFLPELRLKIEHALNTDLQPIPGALQVIEKITVPKAVVSNSQLDRVISSLKVAGLSDQFGQNLFAAEMVERPKPAPDVYLYAADKMGVKPEECLVVEDSEAGATAAHSAGMRVIGILAASHIPEGHEQVVRQAGAFTTVADMEALGVLLKELV